ncbi:MAG TPA: LLM class flavin-dependent oxidoreductase [Xanthobacteraceae bacterium]|jgi:alkanesulfonate monooxygenase SsuD/methylene tetrahydromethanopterin reductase-like flavin-dependent oxidoreductase (luciferase family)
MKFSYFHLMPWTELDEAPQQWPASNKTFDPARGKELYDSYIDTMAFAEQCGFDWVGCNEHHFSPYGLMANCNLIGSVLSQRTKSIKLAMLGNLIPLLNPIRVAEEYAMIDVMSGGRLVAGLIRGVPHEYIAYNVIPGESRERLREATALIIKAWTEPEPFGWEGEFYQYPSVSIWPKPMQRPHPKILMSASNEESAEFAGQHKAMMGMTLIADLKIAQRCINVYRQSAEGHGFEPRPEDILIGQNTCIADSDEEAKEHLSRGLSYFHKVLMHSIRDAMRLVVQKSRFFAQEQYGERFVNRLATLNARNIDEMIEAGSVLCGSPKTVIKQMKRIRGELGNGRFNLNMKIGNIPDKVVRRGMELFRDKVLPEAASL